MSSDTILGVTARRVGDLPEATDGLMPEAPEWTEGR